MSVRAPNPQQQAAIDEAGVVFVSAGAGTGKTTVLVERFVRAVAERGMGLESVLVITYTERAAGELRARIRERLLELDRIDLARDIDRAWISTIHGFCNRLLKSHPFEAGLDPGFRVLDESQSRVLRSEAFTEALARFCAGREPDRLELLATYGSRRLSVMLGGVYERLRSAGRPLELGVADESSLTEALAALAECAEALPGNPQAERALSLATGAAPRADELLDLDDLRPTEKIAALAGFKDALANVESAALDEMASRDRELLEELLRGFDAAYREAKARESGVDFEDLQLYARDLLLSSDEVREKARWRFRSVLVDEFQDTNRLQCELVDALDAEELFFVGDEFQSIYRFRHADVEVFRERRAQSAGVLALTQNYRSRPEILGVINHLFGTEFGTDYEPLVAAGRFPELAGPGVELLVTDKAAYKGGKVHWREAESKHVARRVRQLVDAGEATPGEIVLLFAAGTDAERYEEALREEGLPTYRAAGRGYFGQQQVADLVAYLRLIQNRYDDEALVAVLASPFVGVSNDGLVLLRRSAGRRPLFAGLERELPGGLSQRDSRLYEAFRQRYDRLVRSAERAGLERLCEQIVVEHDYDLAVLAQWDGRRRYANLRKLGRLARAYESLRGPDIEGFVGFLRDQEAAGSREVEAAAEEEGGEAVRLLTVHAAKGLEFKVVVLADAGRIPPSPAADEILCLPDGRFGFRVVNPATGKRESAFGWDDVREAEQTADQAENRRLLYVAMTRAIDRLIVSGAIDPGSRRDANAPLHWILKRLEIEVDGDDPVELERGDAKLLMRVDRPGPPSEAPVPAGAPQLQLFAPPEEGTTLRPAPELPALAPLPEPPPFVLRSLSYSALALYDQCSYRFYAQRIVGLPPKPYVVQTGEEVEGLLATEIGDAVHVLLEVEAPEEEIRDRVLARYPGATEENLERVEALLAAWRESKLGRRLSEAEDTQPELAFSFAHDGVLVRGRFDVFRREGERALVVDYKTNRLEEREPSDIVEAEYRLQRLVYALAAFGTGAAEVDVVYTFLEAPADPVSTRFTREELPDLQAELSGAIRAIQEGDFRPTPSEFACAGCPALDVVCAGPRLLSVGG